MRRLVFATLLVTLWILAWGELTVANLLSGVIVTLGVLLVFPARSRGADHLHYDAVGIVRLGAYVVVQLVTSNIEMTRQILRRRARRSGVLAHRLQRPSDEIITVMSSIIALSPGTMTVDVERDSSVVYVHFFDLRDIARARRGLAQLEQRVIDAIAARRGDDPGPVETFPFEKG
jgi:multicomponent Na+:H+ antiporter subunit E